MEEAGAGDFLTIQEAVDAASRGGTILVKAGDYPGFTIEGKALQVVAESGHQVRVTEHVWIKNQRNGDDLYLSGFAARYWMGHAGPPAGGVHGGLTLLEHGQSLDPSGPVGGYGVEVFGVTRAFTAVSSTLAGSDSDNSHGLHAIAVGTNNITERRSTTPCCVGATGATASAGAASPEATVARARGWARGVCSHSVSRSCRVCPVPAVRQGTWARTSFSPGPASTLRWATLGPGSRFRIS